MLLVSFKKILSPPLGVGIPCPDRGLLALWKSVQLPGVGAQPDSSISNGHPPPTGTPLPCLGQWAVEWSGGMEGEAQRKCWAKNNSLDNPQDDAEDAVPKKPQ